MGFFDKMKASVGIGGAKVELQLDGAPIARASYAKGTVVLKGGKLAQKCNDIIVQVRRTKIVRQTVDGNTKDVDQTDTVTEEHLAKYEQDIEPGSERHFSFSIMIPDEGGEEHRVRYAISASADIPGAIDPSDTKNISTTAPAAATVQNIPQLLETAVGLERAGDKEVQLISVLKQIVNLDPKETQALKMLARHMAYSSAAEAAAYFKRYLDEVPLDGEIWQEFAQSTFDRGAHQEALGYSDKATELMPKSAYAWQHKARIYEKLEKIDDAVKAYEQSKKADHPSNRLDVDKAQMLQRANRLQEASEAYLEAGKKGDPYTLEDVLEGLKASGVSGRDQEFIDLAKNKDPEQYWAWQVHAKWVIDSDPQTAISQVETALTKNVSSEWSRADLLVLKGRAFEKLTRKAEAKATYEAALKQCKDHYDAQQRLKAL